MKESVESEVKLGRERAPVLDVHEGTLASEVPGRTTIRYIRGADLVILGGIMRRG